MKGNRRKVETNEKIEKHGYPFYCLLPPIKSWRLS